MLFTTESCDFSRGRFNRRLSESKYKENLILKGGFLLYSISGFTTRPTVDADYLLKNYSNDLDAIERLVEEIISLPSKNDFIKFEIKGLELISEIREYHDIRVNLILLPEFEKPKVLTYSLESTVAEKLDAIISLMEATGRMKDFYDIYYLATTFDFDGRKLQEAIYETLSNRGTPYEKDSVDVIARLTKDVEMQKRWDNFCKKILRYELNFDHVVNIIIEFTSPPYESMTEEDEFFKEWSSKDRKYI